MIIPHRHDGPIVRTHHNPRQILVEIGLALLKVTDSGRLFHRAVDHAPIVVLCLGEVEALHLRCDLIDQGLHGLHHVHLVDRFVGMGLDKVEKGMLILVDDGALLLCSAPSSMGAGIRTLKVRAICHAEILHHLNRQRIILDLADLALLQHTEDDEGQDLVQR